MDLMANLPSAQTNRRGLTVNGNMQMSGAETVFALGDCTSSAYAPTAQVASQQGAYLARQFAQLAKKDALEAQLNDARSRSNLDPEGKAEISMIEKQLARIKDQPFKYSHQGTLASVTHNARFISRSDVTDRYIGSDKAIADLPFLNGNVSRLILTL